MKLKIFSIILIVLFAIALFYVLNYRVGNPGRIDVLGSGSINLDSILVQFPIDRDSIKSGYYMDGGTLMIQCRDFRQQEIKFCIDHRMGGEANWGDIYFGSIHPRRSGGVNLGKSKEWSQFIYSVAILDNHLDFFGYQSIDYWYPKIGEKLFNKIDEIYRKIIYDFKQIIKQIT